MGNHHAHRALWLALFALVLGQSTLAEAQLVRRVVRLSIDTDLLSMAGVEVEDPNGGESQTTVYGIGPNQFGGSLAAPGAALGPTPLGLGLAFGLGPKLLLGMRIGLGLDVIAPEGAEDTMRVLTLSLAPGFTLVPVGERAKLFLSASPIVQFDRIRAADEKTRTILGGFGLGIGTLIFVARAASIDLGFHFEGRFGNYENDLGAEWALRDLRGLLRFGVSIWK